MLYDRCVPLKLKSKFYQTIIVPALLYGSKYWTFEKDNSRKMRAAEMWMIQWMDEHILEFETKLLETV